jgi:hypothetical protein
MSEAILVRSPGIEPGSSAWEADVLPGWTKTAQTAIRQITWQLKLLSLTCASPTSKIVISNKPNRIAQTGETGDAQNLHLHGCRRKS